MACTAALHRIEGVVVGGIWQAIAIGAGWYVEDDDGWGVEGGVGGVSGSVGFVSVAIASAVAVVRPVVPVVR